MLVKHRHLLLILVSMSFFMEVMDARVLSTSLPQIAIQLHTSPVNLKMALTCYLLSVGLFVPMNRYLADRFGVKTLFMCANLVFLLASLGCALSHSMLELVLFRIGQGIGGAFLAPTSRLIMLKLYQKKELYQAQVTAAMVVSMALLLGPLLGGALTTFASWRYIFLINIPIALMVIALVWRLMPAFTSENKHPFSWPGFALMAIFLLSLLSFFDILTDPHWLAVIKISLLSLALLTLVSFVIQQRSSNKQLFHSDIWHNTSAVYGFSASFTIRLAIYSTSFLLPLLLQMIYGYSAFYSGMFLATAAIGVIIAKQSLNHMISTIGSDKMLLACVLTLLGLMIALSVVASHFHVWFLLLIMLLMGYTQGNIFTITNVSIYQSLDQATQSTGTTLNSMIIQLSGSFSVAIAAMCLIYFKHLNGELSAMDFSSVFIIESALLCLCIPFYQQVCQRLREA